MMRNRLLPLAALFLAAAAARADVRLPHVFGDHMVLQKGKPLNVWGWAAPGEAVTVSSGGATAKATANDKGEWRVALPGPTKAGPGDLTVSGKNTIELRDVLVGEVWLCSGQSNMEMGASAAANGKAEVAAADHPEIRLFLVPKRASATARDDVDAEWKVCSPESIVQGGWGGFSAAGYYFGRELNKELNVPVGLIESSWGGTRIEPWAPPEGFASDPALADVDRQRRLADPAAPEHKERFEKYMAELSTWEAAARKAADASEPVPAMPGFPAELNFRDDPQTPTALYNGMLHGIVPFSIRGALWYQGEANHSESPQRYVELTRAKVGAWRKRWGDDFPYYYVQIAPYRYGDEQPSVLAKFWEGQADIMRQVPGTGMVVTNDIGNADDIHPANKQEVGRRLALWALNKTYGKADVVPSGPIFRAAKPDGSALRVTFDYGSGLKTLDGKPPSDFEIIDAEQGGWVKADARVDGDAVVLTSASVPHPVAVRFAWDKLASPNLRNGAGLPASAFQGGEAIHRDNLALHVPEAKEYKLAYDLDLAKLTPVTYDVDVHAKLSGHVARVAYFVELGGADGATKYVWVSMDAFTQDLGKIAVPTASSGATFQANVADMTVVSNVPGVVNGTHLNGGNIEFWPNNYVATNAAGVPGASDAAFDFGDQMVDPIEGHGSMQVHNHDAKQTIFALNHWREASKADLGIGNAPSGNPDWTFWNNSGSYETKRLRVFVKLDQADGPPFGALRRVANWG